MPILYENIPLVAGSVDVPAIPESDVELMEYLEHCNKVSFEGILKITKAAFNSRLKTTAGRAWRSGKVEMNTHIECKYEFLSTALHELTHLYEFQSFGDSSHGKRFIRINQQAVNLFGLGSVIRASSRHSHKALKKKVTKKAKPRWVCLNESCSKHAEGVLFRIPRSEHAMISKGLYIPRCPSCETTLVKRTVF